MTLTNKIKAWAAMSIIAIPAIMVFSDNYDTTYINLIGMAYCWLMSRIFRRILPNWMVEYFCEKKDTDTDFFS